MLAGAADDHQDQQPSVDDGDSDDGEADGNPVAIEVDNAADDAANRQADVVQTCPEGHAFNEHRQLCEGEFNQLLNRIPSRVYGFDLCVRVCGAQKVIVNCGYFD